MRVTAGLGVALALAAVSLAYPVSAAEWEKLTGCRLVPNESNDGDSFHVTHEGKEYIFRLYFVDCPETDDHVPERVKEQSEVFGVNVEDVYRTGHRAAEFTHSELAHEFDVYTRWEDALGASRMPRFYAIINVKGQDLAERLVQEGLARVHGAKTDGPHGADKTAIEDKLQKLCTQAQASRNGIWRESKLLAASSAEPDHDSVRSRLMTREQMMASLQPDTSTSLPETVVCSNLVSAYTIKTPYEQVGYFQAGAELRVVRFIDRSMVEVKFTSPSGQAVEASCKYWELGLPAGEAL